MILNNENIKVETFPEVDTIKQRKDEKNHRKMWIIEKCLLCFIFFLLLLGFTLRHYSSEKYRLVILLLTAIVFVVSIWCFIRFKKKINSLSIHSSEAYGDVNSYRRIWKDIENSIKTGNAKIKLKRSNKSGDFTKLKISYLNENDVFCKEKFWLKDVYYKDSPDDRITISFYSTEEKDWTPFENNEYVSITLPISYLYKKEEDDEIEKEANKTKGDE